MLNSEQKQKCLDCPYGSEKKDEFLSNNNSAFDAAIDMEAFVNECYDKSLHSDCLIKDKRA